MVEAGETPITGLHNMALELTAWRRLSEPGSLVQRNWGDHFGAATQLHVMRTCAVAKTNVRRGDQE
jgi:hypothetical protein